GSKMWIVSLWGALQDTSLVEAADPHIPVLLTHGTADAIVPFGLGSPFQVPTLSATYGSQLIDKRLAGLAYPHETYFVQGEGHEFYGVVNGNWSPAPNQYWYIIVDRVRDFLFDIHKPAASFDQIVNGAQVTFTNNSTNAIAWRWDFGDGSTSEVQSPSHTYTLSGSYNVTMTAYSRVFSTDAETKVVNVTVTSAPEEITLTTVLLQNYPNPFNPSTTIEYSLNTTSKVKLEIYDLLGRLVERIADKVESAGTKRIVWNAKNLSGGVYIIKMEAVANDGNSYSSFKKLLLLK
ncbi:MAG: PKD domain-containing protein, partial [Bacteroidetes bacterium]|nr:PKD domain-containing protein [Bacteroidota bacterium]